MASIKPTIRGRGDEKTIYVRIADRDRNRFVSLEQAVRPKHWSRANREVKKSHRDHVKLNGIIQKAVHTIENIALDMGLRGEPVTADRLQRLYKASLRTDEPEDEDFLAYADGVVDYLSRLGKVHTARRYRSIIKKLRAYCGSDGLPFEDLTGRFLRDYRAHLASHYGNVENTQIANLRGIRAICNRAIDEGLVPPSWYPFARIKVGQERTSKRRLTREEVRAMADLELASGSVEARARDAFVFAFHAAGPRFTDVCLLRHADIEADDVGPVLRYTMSKNNEPVEVPICRPAMDIVRRNEPVGGASPDEYIFPFLRVGTCPRRSAGSTRSAPRTPSSTRRSSGSRRPPESPGPRRSPSTCPDGVGRPTRSGRGGPWSRSSTACGTRTKTSPSTTRGRWAASSSSRGTGRSIRTGEPASSSWEHDGERPL